MTFFRRLASGATSLGIFPGSFNPVTVAHLALATAALQQVDEVLFVLPQAFPHKEFSGASFSQRLAILGSAVSENPRFSVASSEGGLFLEISEECRKSYGAEVRQSFLCGRDAAERIVSWNYERPGVLRDMLDRFDFLVAGRKGDYVAPELEAKSFKRLELTGEFDLVSASEVRSRIACGLPWEALVPPATRDQIREVYLPIARQWAE